MTKQRRWTIRTSILVTASLGSMVTGGCLQLGDEDCARRGGDLACDGGKCVMSLERNTGTPDSCVDEIPERGGFVHVKYGLPDDFRTFSSNLELAVDRRSPPLSCDMDKVGELQAGFDVLHAEVIEPLYGNRGVRRGSIDLGKIDEFTAAVDAWLAARCEERPGGTAADAGTSGTGPSSGEAEGDPDVPMGDCSSCPTSKPFCDSAMPECFSCDEMPNPDGACAELGESTPLCVGGICVACTAASTAVCDEDRTVCDTQTNACVSCTDHSQCEIGACALAEGRCFGSTADVPLEVFIVDGDGGPDVDFLQVSEAVDAVDELGLIWIRGFGPDGETAYDPVVIAGGKTIALHAMSPDDRPRVRGLQTEGSNTNVYIDGLVLLAISEVGLQLGPNTSAWLDRTWVVLNTEGGIVAEQGAELYLRTSIVGSNGLGGSPGRGLDVQGATVDVLYTTVANNVASDDGGTGGSIRCTMGGSVTVRNSIVVGSEQHSIDCDDIEISHSAVDQDIGNQNELVGAWRSEWVVLEGGNFHLTPEGKEQFDGVARWIAGDPREDVDGEARPTIPNTPDCAGADLLP